MNWKEYKNKARCKNCDDIIESKYRHDFVACSCFSNSLDNTGIYVDGGSDYWRCGGELENFEKIYELLEEVTE